MRKELLKASLILIVSAFVSALAVTQAVAGFPMSTQCDFVDSKGGYSGFTMKILPDASGNWPVWNAVTGKWDWKYGLYSVSGSFSQINQVDFVTPACNPPLDLSSANVTLLPPGTGDPSSGFGWWTGNDFVARVTPSPNSSPLLYTLSTSSILPSRNSYLGMKSGAKDYACKSIASPACPDCPGLPFLPSTVTQCMQVEGHNVMIVRNENRCITDVYDCGANDPLSPTNNPFCADYTTSCRRIDPNVSVTVNALTPDAKTQSGITVGDILGNQICPEGILFSASSPGCVNVRTTSGWTQICR